MPFTKKDLEDLPISFCGKDDVWVIVGPCSATYWKDYKIALDGRKYKTGGTINFKKMDKSLEQVSTLIQQRSTLLAKKVFI